MARDDDFMQSVKTSSLAPFNQNSKIKFLDEDWTMDSTIFWRELYPSLNVIQPRHPNPDGFDKYLTRLTEEEKAFVAKQNQMTKKVIAWNLRKDVDGKGIEKSTFFVDHGTNVPTSIPRGKLPPYKPYQEVGGILKIPFKDSSNSLNPQGQDTSNKSQQRGSECYGRPNMPTYSERTQWIGNEDIS